MCHNINAVCEKFCFTLKPGLQKDAFNSSQNLREYRTTALIL